MNSNTFHNLPEDMKTQFKETEDKTLQELINEHGPEHKIRMLELKPNAILKKHNKKFKAGSK